MVSSTAFVSSHSANPSLYADTTLFTPVPDADSPLVESLVDFITSGGKALFYGPISRADKRVTSLLNLKTAVSLEGELSLENHLRLDCIESGAYPERIIHRPLSCAGGIAEILADPADPSTTPCAAYRQNGENRIAALTRSDPTWNGGRVGWVRGTVSSSTDRPTSSRPIPDDPAELYHGSRLARLILTEFDLLLGVDKAVPEDRAPLLFVSRSNNGFFFSGHAPDTTVRSRFRLPLGAPIVNGLETRLEDGCSTYYLGKSFHRQCRAFVEQDAPGTLSCLERGARSLKVKRCLQISGLKQATLRFFPEADAVDRPITATRFIRQYDPSPEPVPFTFSEDRSHLIIHDYTGDLTLEW